MTGRICLFLYILLLPGWVNAQQQFILKGFLGVEGGESFDFKIAFRDSSGFLTGYSYTWLEEKKLVKASITGKIDRTNKTLSFRETEIVSNTGFQSNVTICLIDASLKYKNEDGHMSFSGPITSSDITNITCARGSITFPDNDALNKIFEKPERQDTLKTATRTIAKQQKPVRIIYDTARHEEPAKIPANEPDKITTGIEKTYQWWSDTIILEIWDGGHVDGDIVSIYFNNEPVLEKYAINKSIKKVTIPISGTSVNTITILAGNEGSEPPNTTDILLRDGSQTYHLIAYNTIGKKAVIKIRRIK